MVNALFEKGREGFLDGTIDWDTNTIKAMAVDLVAFTDTGVKAVTAASNATPIVVTATSHGFTNGDLVYIFNVGGNLAANGFWKIANVAANTMELTNPVLATNAVGSAAYTSGGVAVNLGPSASGDNIDDFDGCRIGTDQTLTSPTVVAGVADAADITFPTVTAGNNMHGYVIYKDTGTPSTSRVVALTTGKAIVTCSKLSSASATSVDVEVLTIPIASGQVLTFSNGATATLSGVAAVGDRTLTVSALAANITAGSRALANASGSGLPVATNGGSITVAFDSGANRIFKL